MRPFHRASVSSWSTDEFPLVPLVAKRFVAARSPPTELKFRWPGPWGTTIVNPLASAQPRSAASACGRLRTDCAVDGEATGGLISGHDGRHLGVHVIGWVDPLSGHVDEGEADRLQLGARFAEGDRLGRLVAGTQPDVVPAETQGGWSHAAAYQLGVVADSRGSGDGLLEGRHLLLGAEGEPIG